MVKILFSVHELLGLIKRQTPVVEASRTVVFEEFPIESLRSPLTESLYAWQPVVVANDLGIFTTGFGDSRCHRHYHCHR